MDDPTKRSNVQPGIVMEVVPFARGLQRKALRETSAAHISGM